MASRMRCRSHSRLEQSEAGDTVGAGEWGLEGEKEEGIGETSPWGTNPGL